MDIKQLKAEKTKLENEISNFVTKRIEEFKEKTGVSVSAIDFGFIQYRFSDGSATVIPTGTKIEIEI